MELALLQLGVSSNHDAHTHKPIMMHNAPGEHTTAMLKYDNPTPLAMAVSNFAAYELRVTVLHDLHVGVCIAVDVALNEHTCPA